LSKNIKTLDDLLDRVGLLDARVARAIADMKAKELEEKHMSEPDEFDEMEEIALWEQELAKHGIDSSYESLTNPCNSDRIWAIYQSWSYGREQRQS
jgi:hypothetical protein